MLKFFVSIRGPIIVARVSSQILVKIDRRPGIMAPKKLESNQI